METLILALVIASIFLGAFLLLPRPSRKGTTKSGYPNFSTGFFTCPERFKATSYDIVNAIYTRAGKTYTKEEISQHNKKNDCWIIVKGKVYDVTPYVEEHPGGDAILNNAGRDSTEGFYGPQHASRVFDMVDEFYIGDLKS